MFMSVNIIIIVIKRFNFQQLERLYEASVGRTYILKLKKERNALKPLAQAHHRQFSEKHFSREKESNFAEVDH